MLEACSFVVPLFQEVLAIEPGLLAESVVS